MDNIFAKLANLYNAAKFSLVFYFVFQKKYFLYLGKAGIKCPVAVQIPFMMFLLVFLKFFPRL